MNNYAETELREGTLFSKKYNDYYSSKKDALSESTYVFLEKNNLIQRWLNLPENKDLFTIGEVGFGGGINFLNCCKKWLELDLKNKRLAYFATEKMPLKLDDMKILHGFYESLNAVSHQLLDTYPKLTEGFNLIELFNGKVQLCLIIDDAEIGFSQLIQSKQNSNTSYFESFDCWFLDGFSPNLNPSAWSSNLLKQVARLSSKHTTLSSFSAASKLQKTLAENGFNVSICKGFGGKRSMITASYKDNHNISPYVNPLGWHVEKYTPTRFKKKQNITIIGGGITGCLTAVALKKRGFNITILDQHGDVAIEASGNNRAVLYPRLSAHSSSLADLNMIALQFASNYYKKFWEEECGQQCGVLVLPKSNTEEKIFHNISLRYGRNENFFELLYNKTLKKIAGLNLSAECGLFFPTLGWLSIPKICKNLIREFDIPIISSKADDLRFIASENSWEILNERKKIVNTAHKLVIANSHAAKVFNETSFLSIKKLRGQISQFESNSFSKNLKCVVCAEGYITPSFENSHVCGATYNHNNDFTYTRQVDHQSNLEKIFKIDSLFHEFSKNLNPEDINGRVGFRGTTRDYLPFTGAVPDFTKMKNDFDYLRDDAKKVTQQTGSYLPNLYVNCGMGSRGLTYAPLCAEILASEISNQIPPIPKRIRLDIHPARFIIRDIKKKRI